MTSSRLPIPERNTSSMRAHRRFIVLAGDPGWCKATAQSMLLPNESLWVGDSEGHGSPVIDQNRMRTLLGREVDCLIFDAWCGFDPDAFGIATGLVRGGGSLILLTPQLDQWSEIDDPVAQRMSVYPLVKSTNPSRYLRRFVRMLETDLSVSIYREPVTPQLNEVFQSVRESTSFEVTEDGCITGDQAAAVEAIHHCRYGHRHRPLLLLADRGRGKSAAMGIAARAMLADEGRVIVTAPSKKAAEVVFQHAGDNINEVRASMRFVAPDALLKELPHAELLLVDEAAAIPLPMLSEVLKCYPRIMFSSTVHGYEGSGRGFFLRFRHMLDEITPGWREIHMRQPVRWAAGDPLENFSFRALMLDAETEVFPVADFIPQECEFQWLDRDQLGSDENRLREVFGLLVSAHYETRPTDLRHLLDGPNLSLAVLVRQERILAVALVAREGGLDEDISRKIIVGDRRPRGHLIPQAIAVHLGIDALLQETGWRVVRIAVVPELQRKGIGSHFLKLLTAEALRQDLSWLGVSFGVSEGLPRFWRCSGFLPLWMGSHKASASGAYSLLMVNSLNSETRCWVEKATARFTLSFGHALGDVYRDDLTAATMPVMECCVPGDAPSPEVRRQLMRFAEGRCAYEDVAADLWIFALWAIVIDGVSWAHGERKLLMMRILQKKPWAECAERSGLSGKKQVQQTLRRVVSKVLAPISVEETTNNEKSH